MLSATCPVGYRPVQTSDIAVGMSVIYVSCDGVAIPTQVEDASIMEKEGGGLGVRLAQKHNAALSRIFVAEAAKPNHETPAAASDQGAGTPAAVGAVTAAVGAEVAAAGASAAADGAATKALGAEVADAATLAAAVGAEPEFGDSEVHHANMFLKSAVAPGI